MKLLGADDAIYAISGNHVIKCTRVAQKLVVSSTEELKTLDNAVDLGDYIGLIGKTIVDDECYLIVITQYSKVAKLSFCNDAIHRIDRVCAIPVEQVSVEKFDTSQVFSKFEKLKSSQKKVIQYVTGKTIQLRSIDEILRIFNDSGDFYISVEGDITQSIQSDLFDENDTPVVGANPWILPVCQGFVSNRIVPVDTDIELSITLISRRSVNRAGVRYLKRGTDNDGSVPVFWTQQGNLYRPPLVVKKSLTESLPVFQKHMDALLGCYGKKIVIVNLVEQRGRELPLALSYLEHVLETNSPDVAYFSFDFHFRCRGLKFQKAVADLISALSEDISKMNFCWVDKFGEMVRKQNGVIRTNCVDCLDRTNVVQCAISQAMCLIQIQKLGLIGPQTNAPSEIIQAMQTMWADNGDAISRQYAGTDALKGDVTRSGQRKLVGMVKDGYNSASRYYQSHRRDAQRQRAIDVLLGSSMIVEAESTETTEVEDDEVESIGRLVNEAILFILPEKEVLVGGWALIDATNLSEQIDTVLLLTRTRIVVITYDEDSKLSDVKHIDFDDIVAIQLGKISKSPRTHLRICTRSAQQFTLRAAKTRLFNNVAIPLRTPEEADEYIQAIGEQLKVAMLSANKSIDLAFISALSNESRMEKNKTRIVNMITSVFRPKVDECEHTEQIIFSALKDGQSTIKPTDMKELMNTADLVHSDFDKDGCSKNLIDLTSDCDLTGYVEHATQETKKLTVDQTARIQSSHSESRLSEKADDFLGLLQKLKLPVSKSSNLLSDAQVESNSIKHPFSLFRQQVLDSKSKIMML